MPDLGLQSFNKLYPMMIRKYQDLVVDQNASEKDKINSIIQKLNALGKLSNDVVRDWNTVYNWAMNDGLNTDVSNKLEEMRANGEISQLLQNIYNSLVGDMTTLHTTVKDTFVNVINEVDDLAKANQTAIATIQGKQTTDEANIATNTANIATNTANIASNTSTLAQKATQVNTIADLKALNANVGDVIRTKGYYVVGDNGHGTYQVVSSGIADDGFIVALTNGKFAQLMHNGKIFARQYGVYLDNSHDDTARLNAFFKMFGTAELVVDYGIAKTTGQLNLQGKWNPSTNNGSRKITFINATINYQGVSGKACIQVYNHQKSELVGLSYLKSSVNTYINFVACWYTRISNFDIPKMCFNKNTTDITDTLNTNDSYTNVFEKGVTYQEFELYGIGTTGGGNINSISFENVLFQGNQVTPNAQYNLKFYGTTFQNISFYGCDLSYCTTSNIYIDVAQTSVMRLNFYGCYFDSNIPLVLNYDYKGAIINTSGNQFSGGQPFVVKTRNQLSSVSHGNYDLESGSPKHGGLNLAKNGDFLYPSLSGWQYSGNNTSGGGVGNPIIGFLTNNNAINKNSLQVTFQQTNQYWAINSFPAPMDGVYTLAMRLRKVSGNGSLQLQFKNGTPTFDLTPYALNEELILSTSNAGQIITQGTSMYGTLMCTALGSSPFIIEILEASYTLGGNIGINLPVHPQANMMPLSGSTASRPHTYAVMQQYYDTTLGKPIWVKTLGVREVDTLTINSGATTSGNITITLNGVGVTVAVSAGDSAGTIGDKIRATAFSGWIAGGAGGSSSVTFTKQSSGTNTTPTFADTGTTGTTGSFAVTTSGVTPAWMDNTGTTV